MLHLTILMASPWSKYRVITPLLIAIKMSVVLGLVVLATDLKAQELTSIEIATEVVDNDGIAGPRWRKVSLNPMIFGTHTIRLSWNSDAQIRFSVFQILDGPHPNDRRRIATSRGIANMQIQEWTGMLNPSEQYYLGIWAERGSADFSVTLEAQAVTRSPLQIATHPSALAIAEGENAIFTVETTHKGTREFQWYADNTAINGAVSETLIIRDARQTDSGTTYWVAINDGNSLVTSKAAMLIVKDIPNALTIAEQPSDLTVTLGQEARFTVRASGTGALRYQWFADSTAIHGANGDTLTINSTTLADAGMGYSVLISDEHGSVISGTAVLSTTRQNMSTDKETLPVTEQPNDSDSASMPAKEQQSGG